MKKLLLTVVTVLTVSSMWAVPGTIKSKKGTVRKGEIRWVVTSKSYEVKFGKAAEMIAEDDVESLEIEKPKNFDALVQSVQGGSGGSAVDGLAKITKDYKRLQWDKVAARYLVEAYLQMKNPQKAYDAARVVIEGDQSAAYKGDLAPAYWQTLLALGQRERLENCLRKAVQEASRPLSAEALIMRGDIILKDGAEKPEAHKKALIDAYLKVALMYNDADCLEPRIKAMERSAASLGAIGMSDQAQNMKANAAALSK
jgi:hypothetical protein